ncbi:MAG: hydroxylamine reductase [Elusimicrobiota bacterium]
MFCNQCEQTVRGKGCDTIGVCGKTPENSGIMDELIHTCHEISQYAFAAGKLGKTEKKVDVFLVQALFTTVTNVNFDPDNLRNWTAESRAMLQLAKNTYAAAAGDTQPIVPAAIETFPAEGIEKHGPDVAGLQQMILYGLKGMAAYADHARVLGVEDASVYAFFHEALAFLAADPTDIDALTGMSLRVGEVNLRVMEMLDRANTDTYGHPEPTAVRITPLKGKAILVSGHDLKDLEVLLKITAGTGVNVYTHGEMLPGNAYPGLKKYPHLAGNFGGAWQDQQKEFATFPGPILMTTNCIQKPRASYMDRIYTTGLVAWPGVRHLEHAQFDVLIAAAKKEAGFAEDAPEKRITIGFARNAVMGAAEKVVAAVKAGKLRRFFLIGGCDAAKPGRSYYTELAQAVPQDCAILTLACGKYRFNKMEFGDIDGIPRLLDVGQCNDAHSAIQIALALAKAFDCGVNDLPLSMILSWYEQKAVCILLSLLHLGIRGIRLGPTLPAFVGPEVLKVLSEKFDLKPITTAEQDLKDILPERELAAA